MSGKCDRIRLSRLNGGTEKDTFFAILIAIFHGFRGVFIKQNSVPVNSHVSLLDALKEIIINGIPPVLTTKEYSNN